MKPVVFALALLAACASDNRAAKRLDDGSEDAASAAMSDASDASAQLPDGSSDASLIPTLDAAPLPDAAPPTDAAAPADSTAPGLTDAAPARPACDEVLELRAHGGQTLDDVTPYMVSTTELYERFWFAPNWSTDLHLVGVEPLVDNPLARAFTLFLRTSYSATPGSHQVNSGLASVDTYLLAAWSYEAPNMPIPDDVGIKLAKGDRVRLAFEILYAASGSATNRADRSGVRLCLSRTLRAKEAVLHAIGTASIINVPAMPGRSYTVSGTCTPAQATHLVGYLPRMRSNGRHMRIVTQRNGMDEPLSDRPFGADNKQFVTFPSEVSVQQGDAIKTTCTYDADQPFTYGPFEDDEECFALMLAWPAGSLRSGSRFGFISGEYDCIDGV